ncbi:hypothetical protein RIVM261_057100 [Rivularia sp. IAM M-261]|nr:hypothetical protein CAL7716_032100 [Calothrix sp. PCC 7716]GJD20754.1 hypothetical protein RIVM261_057100 [Rivularia sp. IAM M-261]
MPTPQEKSNLVFKTLQYIYVLMNTLKINIISFRSYKKNNQFSSNLGIKKLL